MNVLFTQDDKDNLKKVFTDVYIGEDSNNLSIIARLKNLEDKFKSVDKTFWIGVSILATLIGKIIAEHVGLK